MWNQTWVSRLKMNSSVYVQNEVSNWKSTLVHSKAQYEWECCKALAHCNKELLIEWLSLERYSQSHQKSWHGQKVTRSWHRGKVLPCPSLVGQVHFPYLSNYSTIDTIESLPYIITHSQEFQQTSYCHQTVACTWFLFTDKPVILSKELGEKSLTSKG